jgi:peptidoglycan/xylan/chitin deacetylase (PgdA/CDA1 family)/folate-dependent phosphoribosylglycinamide formyltransferase PurN
LKIVFLIGRDSSSTRQSIETVCRLPGVEPVAILLDTEIVGFKRRLTNLSRNIQRNGWSYPALRFIQMIRISLESAVENAVVPRKHAIQILREAFPERSFSLEELGNKYGMAVHHVENLNHDQAVRVLRESKSDLGIVIGTRVLKSTTFSIPRLGCINLHKGKVPQYRGMPPAFWELYDGASSAGITIHFVDKGLDTGDIVASGSIPILNLDTPDTLLEKLTEEGNRLLALAVSLIRDGKAQPRTQHKGSGKPRTRPNRREVESLRLRLPHWKRKGDLSTILRNLYLLSLYYSGIYSLIRHWNLRKRSRAAIFLHHRVNDYSKDVLTVDLETFAAQLLAIAKYYPLTSTRNIVDSIRFVRPIKSTSVAIHFDDCYRDILTNGAPILKAMGIPACAFINSGFVGTQRPYPHDLDKYPFDYEKLSPSDLRLWIELGFDVGAHTVNHMDLGKVFGEAAEHEIIDCGKELEAILSKPVDLFSYPFGQPENISASTREMVRTSGYVALFSAYGGIVDSRTDPYDIPRMGASFDTSPLYCILQIEQLSLSQVLSSFRGLLASLRRHTLARGAVPKGNTAA